MNMNESLEGQKLSLVFSRQSIAERVEIMAREIDAAYGKENLLAICVLKGAFIFFSDLVRRIHNPNLELDFVRLSSYGKNSESSGHVNFSKDVELDIRDKHVLVVEDIVDSGHSMRFLMDQLAARKPRSLRLAALINKRERREADVKVDFPGFDLPGGFLVGYGLDLAEHYRALPDVCEIIMDK